MYILYWHIYISNQLLKSFNAKNYLLVAFDIIDMFLLANHHVVSCRDTNTMHTSVIL
jgi:hypothetical protein